MEEVINFIQNYWSYISVVILFVIQVISIFARKTKAVALTDGQTQLIIDWITEAEKAFGDGHGPEKLNYVISQFRAHYPCSNCEDWVLRSTIDGILKTPTKKGGPGREKAK